ncbi:MAG: hypothetical protein ACREAW_01290 [Nitrososphaera sp.]
MTVSKQAESIHLIAADQVLKRLGIDIYDVVKFHLSHRYNIRLDDNAKPFFSLEELDAALENLIGRGAAELIMQDIYVEIDALSTK